MTTQIPLLDWQDFQHDEAKFVAELGAACRDTGFFLLKGHGIERSLIDAVFDQSQTFFELPEAEKAPLDIYKSPANRGWSRVGSENLDDGGELRDIKEAFNVGLDLAADDPRVVRGDPFRGVNVWPDLPGFQRTMLDYFDAVLKLSVDVHEAIALDLGLPRRWFDQHLDAPLATLRTLWYPADTNGDNETGAGEHTDYGSLTFIMSDGVPGLQLRPRRQAGGEAEWIDVPHYDGAFIVNIADCLMRWTNDLYVSTPHRVLPPARKRQSIAFFLDPNPDSIIEALPTATGPSKYPPISSANYLKMRLNQTYTEEVA
ncbi:MAG: 2-oxoglutarate and iron-dependent oxygenase domain-containing protein [Pseudomonadota bacterium]